MSWSEEELGSIDLGDKRLNARSAKILEFLSSKPQLSIPQQFEGWSETLAAYRFFSNEKVTSSAILDPHIKSTVKRIGEHKEVLLLQDTSELDFSQKQNKIEGLGVLNKETRKGIYLHPLLAVTPERLPLGVLNAEFNCREKLRDSKEDTNKLPIEEKESHRWVRQYQVAAEISRQTPNTNLIVIGDRESDIYELFLERDKLEGSKPDWLVRLQHDRKGKDEETKKILTIKQQLSSSKPLGKVEFNLTSRKGEESRHIEQEIYAVSLKLQPPDRKKDLPSVQATAVLAQEINPPANSKPLMWILLTSISVNSFEDAQEVIQRYLCRWDIELYFKVLKTGCEIEEIQLEHIDKLIPCLAMYMIVAWRVMFLAMVGRTCPDLPCDIVFEDFEWKTIYTVSTKKPPPENPPSINFMVKLVASWGGYLGRKNDPPPGHKAIWTGLQRCRDFVIAFNVIKEDKSLLLT